MSDINHSSESVGNVPHDSENFGTLPNNTEAFRSVPKPSERRENHTRTVREVARMFEAAGVARTERSIINWCQPNKLGIARLDAYFDPNERRYFISPQSVELAIKEEQAKAAKSNEFRGLNERSPKASESDTGAPLQTGEDGNQQDIKTLKQEIMDLKITNRGKDFFIEQLQKEREHFAMERREYIEKLMSSNRKVGELETKLLQLQAPNSGGRADDALDEATG